MLTLLGVGQGQNGVAFDADYQAILSYAITQGYTLPSDTQKLKQNQLVLDLKTVGIWNKLDSFANFANDGSSNFALIDWKRLSLFTAVNSPTFIPNVGFKGNGISSYINMNISPAGNTKYLLGNSSIGAWYNNILTRTNNGIGLGVRTAANNNSSGISPYDATRFVVGLNNSLGFDLVSYTRPTKGYLMVTRDNLDTSDNYVNGIFNSTSLRVERDILTQFNYFCLSYNSGGTPTTFSDDEISIIHIGGSVTGDSLSFYNAINNYITSL
jgi:hypothetical protein